MTPIAWANRIIELFRFFQPPLAVGCSGTHGCAANRPLHEGAKPPCRTAEAVRRFVFWPLAGAKLLAPVQLKVAGESLKVSLETASVKDRRAVEKHAERRENTAEGRN